MFRRHRFGIALILASACSAAPALGAFQVQGLAQFGPQHLAVAFTDSVDVAGALQLSHYSVTAEPGSPPITLQGVSLQDNQRTVVLTATGVLPRAAGYRVAVSGLTSRGGAPLEPGGPTTLTTAAEVVTGIADVQANVNSLIGQTVTVIGQVFVTASSVTGTPSGYIQDATGHGLNVFGSPLQSAVDDLGSVAVVTGTVALYFTTVEITPFTATQIASGMPRLAARPLTLAEASSPTWEGTYIRTTATLASAPTPSGTNHYSYTVSEGGQVFIFRVRNSTGINPSNFAIGDLITAGGAGSAFQGTYQVLVGNAFDFYKGAGPGDITPPALVEAFGDGGSNRVEVTFTEPVGVGASTAANYTVTPTAAPGSPIPVTAAAPAGASVTLTLAAPLQAGTEYALDVRDVQDRAGNPIAAGSRVVFTATVPVAYGVAGVFPFGTSDVGVAFTRGVNASQALQLAHYGFTPALAIASASLLENGQTVVLRTASPLPAATHYEVSVTGVTSATGEPLPASAPLPMDTPSEAVVSIADIHADPAAYTTVTIVGEVTVAVGARGGTPSGYMQDASGRGINLFGAPIQGAVNVVGHVAKVTGTVTPYFTTIEVTAYTATLLAANQPPLKAKRVTVAEANDSRWEGTLIETTGDITDIQPSGSTNINYTIQDAGAVVTFRVGTGLGIPTDQFLIGDRVVGRGAGGSFQSTFQINIASKNDLQLAGTGGPDTIGPRLAGAQGDASSARVLLTFSEPVRSNEATLVQSYGVAPSANPGAPLAILQAVQASNGRSVTLTLATALAGGTSYVVTAHDLFDLAGNPMPTGEAVTFTPIEAPPREAQLEVAAATLIKRMARQGERVEVKISGVLDTRAVCRIFDLRGNVVKVLFDGRLSGTPRRTFSWDGRSDTFELVPAGLYICHLETTDVHGVRSVDRAPIVVAVRLE